ncbi:hypothetical protein C805_00093 [Eubacterium sp. 14-2]|uniref:hypothetical protein n=1 Tax=Eubacterium sp. 14-2 TaxID=1235790 RepID=UPI0003414D35|nr:hypothetical protein [Eubacterium sp. 14-2]EOT29509.1 hypothetical protein C805_00093 [Eubacterium sp. 14-2]
MEELTRMEHDRFHKEFAERMTEEDRRQNRRLDILEGSINHINDITISVEKMAVSMGNVVEELKKQGERLEALEDEPVETFNQIKVAIVTTLVSAIVGASVTAILMIL